MCHVSVWTELQQQFEHQQGIVLLTLRSSMTILLHHDNNELIGWCRISIHRPGDNELVGWCYNSQLVGDRDVVFLISWITCTCCGPRQFVLEFVFPFSYSNLVLLFYFSKSSLTSG